MTMDFTYAARVYIIPVYTFLYTFLANCGKWRGQAVS